MSAPCSRVKNRTLSGPAAESQLARLAARALGHESSDVQTAALKLVRGEAALIAPYVSLLAPSVRAGLEATETAPADLEVRAGTSMLQAALRVEPVTNLNELVEAFAGSRWRTKGPPAEIERAIDGVARIGSIRRRQKKVRSSGLPPD